MRFPSTEPRRTGSAAYERLRRARPELFVNEPGGVEILVDPAEVAAARRAAAAVSGHPEPVGVVYADRFVTVVRDAVRFPDGRSGLYVRVLPSATGPGVVVLPLLTAGVVLVEHYRHATRDWHWEAPRGFGEDGDDGEVGAARELVEEIGARPRALLRLGVVHADTGLLGGRVELFAARIDAVGQPAAREGIRRTRTVSVGEAEAMVADGRLTDSFTVVALTRARLAGLLP